MESAMESADVFAPYMNSRVSGMRSKLFSKQHLEDLLNLYVRESPTAGR